LCRELAQLGKQGGVAVVMVSFDELYERAATQAEAAEAGAADGKRRKEGKGKEKSGGGDRWDVELWHSVRVEALRRVRSLLEGQLEAQQQQQGGSSPLALVLVDDNFYFRSMRKPFFQLARELRVGYQLLYLQCGVQVCLRRNRARAEFQRVPESVILTMDSKLQQPSLSGEPSSSSSSVDSKGRDQGESRGYKGGNRGFMDLEAGALVLRAEACAAGELARVAWECLVHADSAVQARRVPPDLLLEQRQAEQRAEGQRRLQQHSLPAQADLLLRREVGALCKQASVGVDVPQLALGLNRARKALLAEIKADGACAVHLLAGEGLARQLQWVAEAFARRVKDD
jgi:hypothetical protein